MFLKISQILLENTCVAGPQACNLQLYQKEIQHKCFPVKFSRSPFSTEQLRWLLFKISNCNNMFKDVSAISLTRNQSLIACNSHNDKLVWKSIHLPKPCSDRVFCSRFRTNSLLPEIWSKHWQLCCSFALLNNLDI